MNLNDKIQELKILLEEKKVSYQYAVTKLRELFNLLINEISPDSEIKTALAFIKKWEIDFKEFNESEDKKFNNFMNLVDQIVKKTNEDLKLIERGKIPDNSVEKLVDDFSDAENFFDKKRRDELLNDFDIVFRLDIFQKVARRELQSAKRKFIFLNFTFKIFKSLIFVAEVIASYVIGLICEKTFNFDPMLVTIISALICFYTTDSFLEKLKANLFWNELEKIYISINEKHNSFISLKSSFNFFIKKHPKIMDNKSSC